MRVRISDIKIGKRLRKDFGELKSLMESMNHIGLLHPIILDQDYNLVSGARRLEAARNLGWNSIDVKILDIKDKKTRLMIELQENITRMDFNSIELETSKEVIRIHSEKNFFLKTALWIKDKLRS